MAATGDEVNKEILGHARVKALGARHSFNSIADTKGEQISLKKFDGMELDEKKGTVTVGAGVTYGQLAPYLDGRGFAVHNMASLPHISVVGACATGTHGSGNFNGNLSTAVRAMEMVTANGEVMTLSKDTLADELCWDGGWTGRAGSDHKDHACRRACVSDDAGGVRGPFVLRSWRRIWRRFSRAGTV